MITIFTIPKAFSGNINIAQRNAIRSWLQLSPRCEIILFGDEEGVVETARELGVLHIAEIEKNEFGTPFLNSAFNTTQELAKNDILVYINTDIILTLDFVSAVKKIERPMFLMSGRRWDLDIKEEINFNEDDWEEKLQERIKKKGNLHSPSGADYFIFTRNLPHNLPPFTVGRPGWDNWLIYNILKLKIPVIDASQAITVAHQNHESSHLQVKKDDLKKKEAMRNLKLAGGFSNMGTLRDADWLLTENGLEKPPYPRRIFAKMSLFYPWRLLLALKRKIQNVLYAV